jgi:hypothetical protein
VVLLLPDAWCGARVDPSVGVIVRVVDVDDYVVIDCCAALAANRRAPSWLLDALREAHLRGYVSGGDTAAWRKGRGPDGDRAAARATPRGEGVGLGGGVVVVGALPLVEEEEVTLVSTHGGCLPDAHYQILVARMTLAGPLALVPVAPVTPRRPHRPRKLRRRALLIGAHCLLGRHVKRLVLLQSLESRGQSGAHLGGLTRGTYLHLPGTQDIVVPRSRGCATSRRSTTAIPVFHQVVTAFLSAHTYRAPVSAAPL